MNYTKIPSSVKNKIGEIITKNGLLISDFKKSESDFLFSLKYKDSGLEFTFKMSPNDYNQYDYYHTTFTPDRTIIRKNRYLVTTDILLNFNNWITQVVNRYITEENTTTPWTDSRESFNHFSKNDDVICFTPDEATSVKTLIDKMPEVLIKSFSIQHDQIEEFKDSIMIELKEIKEKIDARESKGSIRKILLGTTIEFGLKYSLEMIPVHSIMNYLIDLFGRKTQNLPDQIQDINNLA
jgi:hypothetical protein